MKVNGAENGPIAEAAAFPKSVACGMRASAAAPVPLPSGGGSAAVSKRNSTASPRAVPLYTSVPWITPGAGQRPPSQENWSSPGAMGGVSSLVVEQETGVGAAVLANTTASLDPASLAAELAGVVLDAEEEPEPWRPGELPPPDLAGVLGRWWSEGYEFVFSWRDGRLEARGAAAPEWRRPAVFERVDGDRFRTVSGRERGELLEIVRDGEGNPTKLYWATYAFTRDPRPFGLP